MMKATLEIFWADKVSRYDNLPDSLAISSARISALAGGHTFLTLSEGERVTFEYRTDDCDPRGYVMGRKGTLDEVVIGQGD